MACHGEPWCNLSNMLCQLTHHDFDCLQGKHQHVSSGRTQTLKTRTPLNAQATRVSCTSEQERKSFVSRMNACGVWCGYCSRAMAGVLSADALESRLDENGTDFLSAAMAAGYGAGSTQVRGLATLHKPDTVVWLGKKTQGMLTSPS